MREKTQKENFKNAMFYTHKNTHTHILTNYYYLLRERKRENNPQSGQIVAIAMDTSAAIKLTYKQFTYTKVQANKRTPTVTFIYTNE